MEHAVISGIAFSRDEAKITVLGLSDNLSAAYLVLGPVCAANIEVDMISQGQSVAGKNDLVFTVSRAKYAQTICVLESIRDKIGATGVSGDARVSKVSIIGVGMRSHVGVVLQIFRRLSEEGINILMISTSEIKISVLIDEKLLELAVRILKNSFGLEDVQNQAYESMPLVLAV